jgi:DNA-binding sugar fermentation-stimulating protein
MGPVLYRHDTDLVTGRFIERVNRFVLHVDVDGSTERAFLDETGRLSTVLIDDARVHLNGERVHAFDGARHAWEAQDTVPARVRAGSNRLLVKVCNRDSDWRFNLRITDEEGRSLVSESTEGGVRLRRPLRR